MGCVVDVEGLTLGITATDILFHLGKEEISFPPRAGDRLRRLAGHLLQQRSFYPLYPPNEEINLDMEQVEKPTKVVTRRRGRSICKIESGPCRKRNRHEEVFSVS